RVTDRPLLHLTGLLLDLLQDHRAEKMRAVLVRWPRQDAFGDANHVIPERLPLALLVPHIGTLEQRHHQPLRLHEHHLERTDLCLDGSHPPDSIVLVVPSTAYQGRKKPQGVFPRVCSQIKRVANGLRAWPPWTPKLSRSIAAIVAPRCGFRSTACA